MIIISSYNNFRNLFSLLKELFYLINKNDLELIFQIIYEKSRIYKNKYYLIEKDDNNKLLIS